jgi:hypothetical protein
MANGRQHSSTLKGQAWGVDDLHCTECVLNSVTQGGAATSVLNPPPPVRAAYSTHDALMADWRQLSSTLRRGRPEVCSKSWVGCH